MNFIFIWILKREVNSLVHYAMLCVAATIPKIKHGNIFPFLNIQRFCMLALPEYHAKKMASIASRFPGLEVGVGSLS
jgi:hypothetical protein